MVFTKQWFIKYLESFIFVHVIDKEVMVVQVSWIKSKQKFALWCVMLCTFSFLRSCQVVMSVIASAMNQAVQGYTMRATSDGSMTLTSALF